MSVTLRSFLSIANSFTIDRGGQSIVEVITVTIALPDNVPIPFNYLLQGSMEAGFIITFGIYFSDYPEYKFTSLLFILLHTLFLSYN